MKVLFLMPTVDCGYPNQIGALSAFLKKEGHLTDYLELVYETEVKEKFLLKIKRRIEHFKPDVIGFSVYEMTFREVRKCSDFIKKHFEIPVIAGGYYPTLAPDDVLASGVIDIVCRGEGEYPLLELLECLQFGKDWTGIHNLWIKKNRRIIKNSIRPLIEELDSLPFVDRDIEYSAGTDYELDIMASRGCPFNCSYCANHALRELYPNKGKYVRHRSPANVILEIRRCLDGGKFTAVRFKDETFTSDGKWLENFCGKYRREIGLPFTCNVHPATGSLETLKLLGESGCRFIQMGVESGDEVIREKVLKRKISNKQLIQVFGNARKMGLKVKSYNIFGIPSETRLSRLKTIMLNIRLRPYTVQTNFYYPFKGTQLGDECYRRELVDLEKKDRVNFISNDIVLKFSGLTKTEIIAAKWLNSGIAFLSGNYHLFVPGIKLICRLLKEKVITFFT